MPTKETAIANLTEGDQRRDALIRAVGFDKLNEAQRELALAIANRYELDPMLKHLVMVEGRPYISRDGLLHVAHKSNDFDGIEVTDPVLDERPGPNGKRYWRARATVYRKSFSRPFVYPGRYPMDGGNAKYAEEMCIKVAEVMTLRRAFDVSAPVIEEQWDSESEPLPDAEPEPTSLAERVARKVAEVAGDDAEVSVTVEETAETEGLTETAAEPEPDAESAPEPTEPVAPAPAPESVDDALERTGGFAAPTVGLGHQPLTPDEEPASPIALESFGSWAASRDHEIIRATARQMFPDVRQFNSLTVGQLGRLQQAVELAERAVVTEPTTGSPVDPDVLTDEDREAIAATLRETREGATETAAAVVPESESVPAEPTPPTPFHDDVLTNDAGTPVCGAVSPLSESTCTMDPGHKGAHRAGLKEAW
jgi:hypothetical protein